MKSGTAIGLLVGSAVLLLAVSPHPAVAGAAAAGGATPYPNAGGMFNPLNWFSGGNAQQAGAGGASITPAQIFGGGAGGGFSPALTSGNGLLQYGGAAGPAPAGGGAINADPSVWDGGFLNSGYTPYSTSAGGLTMFGGNYGPAPGGGGSIDANPSIWNGQFQQAAWTTPAYGGGGYMDGATPGGGLYA